jgi:hypothetical protein
MLGGAESVKFFYFELIPSLTDSFREVFLLPQITLSSDVAVTQASSPGITYQPADPAKFCCREPPFSVSQSFWPSDI